VKSKRHNVYQVCLVLDGCGLMNFLPYPWEQEFPKEMVICGQVTGSALSIRTSGWYYMAFRTYVVMYLLPLAGDMAATAEF